MVFVVDLVVDLDLATGALRRNRMSQNKSSSQPREERIARNDELAYGRLNPDGALEDISPFCETRAAHERNNAVVNASNARCQNLESNFMDTSKGTGGGLGASGGNSVSAAD